MPLTLHGLVASHAAERPDSAALHDDRRDLTWGAWQASALRLAACLHDSGVRPGDSVAVFCAKAAELPVSMTAVSMLGARFLAGSAVWPDAASERISGIVGRCFVLALPEAPSFWTVHPVIRLDPGAVFEGDAREPASAPAADPDADVYLNVTSASTGMPMIACATHGNLIANTRGVCRTLGLDSSDVHMSLFSSTSHPHEIFARGILLGGASVLTECRYPREALQLIGRHGVTALMGLPPQLEGLARICSREDADISSLKLVEAGGMHFSNEFAELFGSLAGIDATAVWGSTETTGVVLAGDPGREGFTRVVEGYRVELRDADGAVVEEGEGEMWVSGEAVVSRYAGDRASTEAGFVNGWFRTGDVFRREDGCLHFVGRVGGLIKSAGLKVHPLEVELALLRHPGIADAAVAGEDHPSRGETVSAWVTTRPGAVVSPQELRRFLRGRLEDYKIPRTFHFVDDLPKTPAGKIDRTALGRAPAGADPRADILRTDIELVRLLNHRRQTMSRMEQSYDGNWLEEQLSSAAGHNPGPLSDDTVREILAFIIDMMTRR
ncbi:AMP-binding protein [Candidatus Fermentibacteria bacterium]|nr:AMP-binding protein [Candidatus Fermentibacteria bacterium]